MNHTDDWHRDVCRGILMAYFLMLVGIYPFYAPGGYLQIGEVKYVFFRNVSLVTLAVVAVIILLTAVVRRDREWIIRNYRRMSVTDWFAYGYFVLVMLSYLCSAYKEDALWGVEGWRMGVITQMTMILIYFLFSRYFHSDLRWIGVWLSAAAAVFLLGICNRYSLYPIAMEGQTAAFISTLGNINWFCGYWSVTAPIGIALYWCSDQIWIRTAAGIYGMIAMMSGVTQGSESAYLVFAAVLIMLLVLSLRSSTRMYRLLELCMMFAGSCLLSKLMMHLPGLEWNYMLIEGDTSFGATTALLYGNAAIWVFLFALVCYVVLRVIEGHGRLQAANGTEKSGRRTGIAETAVVAAVCIAGLILLVGSGVLYSGEASDATGGDGYRTVFNDNWGNGRGAAWNCGINAYRSMDALHKIVGVGSDCFADYVYDVPELADRLADQFVNQRLTNAHNEHLTLLVNVGVLGWMCYAGFFITAFVRYVKGARRQPFLYLCAVSMLAYTVHNMVSFQQVLNTPYIFIVLGIGEGLLRKESGFDNMPMEENNIQTQSVSARLETVERIAEYFVAVLMIVLCAALAFYAEDGYHRIGNAKFVAYRNIMLIGCIVLFVVMVPYLLFYVREHKKMKISVTDGCVLAYLILSGISVVSGGFYGDALWGYNGWNMGLISQLGFVLLYLFVSRFGKHYRLILAVLLVSACIVYGIGILHRLLIDPIGFYDGLTDLQKVQFLSTLGQTSWYGSFLAVTLPIGMGVYLYTDHRVWRILSSIFMMLGFGTLVTQNSDSAYFALAGACIIFFMISVQDRMMLGRFMGALTLCFASGKIMYFLMQVHPNPEFKPDFVTSLMWNSGVTWVLLIICLFATILLYAMQMKTGPRKYPETVVRRLRLIVPAAVIAAIVGVIVVIILQTRGALPKAVSDRLADVNYFNWNNEWGNGRGRIWRFSLKMFSEADLKHKLFGVGPDCFHSYVAARYGEEQTLYWGSKQLTNAHNEWMTSLMNVGIFGTVSYLGIYVTAIGRFCRVHHRNLLLAGIAAACASYMCYNFFCYQQVLCTPFIFLLMGIGEYILRDLVDKT